MAAVEPLGLVGGRQAEEGDDHVGPSGEGDGLGRELLVVVAGVDAVPGGEGDLHLVRDAGPELLQRRRRPGSG